MLGKFCQLLHFSANSVSVAGPESTTEIRENWETWCGGVAIMCILSHSSWKFDPRYVELSVAASEVFQVP